MVTEVPINQIIRSRTQSLSSRVPLPTRDSIKNILDLKLNTGYIVITNIFVIKRLR
jgi:hypothetical protein